MNSNPSQRGMNRPLFMPTLTPMVSSSSVQQVVMTSGGGVTPVFTTSMGQTVGLSSVSLPPEHTPHMLHSQPMSKVMQQQKPKYSVPRADLYLCKTSKNASELIKDEVMDSSEKLSLSDIEQSFKELTSHKIKDSLSSFLPHIPGELDRPLDSPDTMLRHLLEQRNIGGKEFSPLSGQALLGFRLLPGPLPEQYRMDPPSLNPKPHKRRKHKHKNIEKGEDTLEGAAPLSKAEVPPDAYSFIKQDSSFTSSHISTYNPTHTSGYMSNVVSDASVGGMAVQHQTAKVILAQSFQPTLALPNIAGPPSQLISGGSMIIDSRPSAFPGKKPKKEKRKNKDKKEKKKEKKKKRERHHPTDAPGPGPAPSLLSHTQPSFNQFSNT